MKKTITAIGNEILHEQFKENKDYNVIGKDIQYQEGILEVLTQNQEIELLIMSDSLPGDFSLQEIIKKIKRKKESICIYLLCDKETEKMASFLKEGWIEKIIPQRTENTILREESDFENDELRKEIERLKKENSKLKKEKIRYGKVVVFLGEENVGKTSIAFMMSQMAKVSRVLLIDFDEFYSGMIMLTNLEKKEEQKKKFNKKTDVCRGKDFIDNFEKKLELFKYQYDLILIDTNTQNRQENMYLSQLADTTIFVVESSYLGNIKARYRMEENRFAFNQGKVKILFNRYSKDSLHKIRLMQNFAGFSILGFLSERSCYAKNMNHSCQEKYGARFEKREYSKILERIWNPEKMTETEWMEKLKKER